MRQTVLLAALVFGLSCGCSKKTDTTTTTPDVTSEQPQPPAPGATTAVEEPPNAPVPVPVPSDTTTKPSDAKADTGAPDLNQLTMQLRGWMMNNRTGPPASWEEYISKSHAQVSPPPLGKKYVITKRAWVVLENK
jgi:hypothetical protein